MLKKLLVAPPPVSARSAIFSVATSWFGRVGRWPIFPSGGSGKIDVPPRATVDDVLNCPYPNTVSFSQRRNGFGGFKNFYSLLIRENGVWVRLSNGGAEFMSSFGNHISCVFRACSKEKMGWLAARRIITLVANQKSGRNLADEKFVRKTMDEMSIPAAMHKTPVPSVIFDARPIPTSIVNHKVFEKMAAYGAILSPKRLGHKFFAAYSAKPRNSIWPSGKWHTAGYLSSLVVATTVMMVPAYPQSVLQSGAVTPGHIPGWVSNGVIGDGGTASDSPVTSIGVTSNSTAGICVSSGRSTAAGRQQLCLGAPLSGDAVISLQNYGTATAQNLKFVINGTEIVIPTGGAGFLQYSGTLVSGHMPCFSGTAGVVVDCGVGAGAGTQYGLAYYSAAGTIGSTAAATNGQIVVGQTSAAPLWRTMSGDGTMSAAGALTITGINGVSFPASPSVGTAPYVSSTNTITYGQVPVTGGGTGAATLTAGGIVVGNGTSAVSVVSTANVNYCLLSQGTGVAPVWATCASGSGNAAGSNTQVQFNSSSNLAGSANFTWVSPTLTLGVNGSASGQLAFANSTGLGQSVTVQNVSATSAYNFNLPASAGSSGQPLLSGGGGATGMSFGTLGVAGGGTNCSVASGTCLDNITGFSGTGFLTRNGAGSYSFSGNPIAVSIGGTGLSSGTSGGILGFTAVGTIASSSLLTANGVLYGGGAGVLPLATAVGTTGQILKANTGAAPTWSTAAFPSTATSTGTILRANGTDWVATTATYPTTTTINQILYSSSANVIAGLATANGSILNTSSSGVPSLTPTPVLGVAGTTVGTLGFQNATSGTITLSPVAGALGTVTLTLPAATDTVAVLAASQAFTNKTYNGNTWTSGSGTLTLSTKTLTISNTLTLAGTDSTTMTFPSTNGTIAALNIAAQTLTGGANVTSGNLGTVSSGTTTLNCGTVPLQYLTNNGAFTLAAPANDGSCIINVTNGASAGTITFSGWTVGTNTGDTYATTNTNKYSLFVRRINSVSSYQWSALQ